MKKSLKTLIATVSIFSLVTISTFAAQVLPSNVKLEGNADGIVFIPGDELFLYKFNMVPGDSVSREMTIKNEYDHAYELYMRAQRVSPEEEYDLLEKLDLEIVYGNNVIYNGSASGEGGLEENIYLGTYYPGDEVKLFAEASLDGKTTGNEYRNKRAVVDWIFTAVRIECPEGSECPDEPICPENPQQPNEPQNPEIPVNPEESTNTEKPQSIPNTGGVDSHRVIGYGVLLVVAGSALFIKKKSKNANL